MDNIAKKIGTGYISIGLFLITITLGICLCVFAPIGMENTGVAKIANELGYKIAEVSVSQTYPVYRDLGISTFNGFQEGINKIPPVPDALSNNQSTTNVATAKPATSATATSVVTPTAIPQPLVNSPESIAARNAWMGVVNNTRTPVDLTNVRKLVDIALKLYPQGDPLASKLHQMLVVCEVADAKISKLTPENAKEQLTVAEYLNKCNSLIVRPYYVARFAKLLDFSNKPLPTANEILLDGLVIKVGAKVTGRDRVMADTDTYNVSVLPDNEYKNLLPVVVVQLTSTQLDGMLKGSKWKEAWPSDKFYTAKVPGGTGNIFPKDLKNPPDPMSK